MLSIKKPSSLTAPCCAPHLEGVCVFFFFLLYDSKWRTQIKRKKKDKKKSQRETNEERNLEYAKQVANDLSWERGLQISSDNLRATAKFEAARE